MAAKKCSQCGEFKLTRYFSVRKGMRKKDGGPMYYSVCHKCKREKQRLIMAAKKKERGGSCEICGKKITFYAHRCVEHKATGTEYEKSKKPIDPKYLVRGTISGGNRQCAISVEA